MSDLTRPQGHDCRSRRAGRVHDAVFAMEENICFAKGDVRVLECAIEKVRAETPDDHDLHALLDHVEHRLFRTILAIEKDWRRALDACRAERPEIRAA